MTETPGSPRAARLAPPRWFDTRFVLGVVLVLTSVLVGARVLAGADTTQQVWLAARDLAPGTVLAVTLERKGGSPTGVAQGPIVAVGTITPI